MKRSWRLAPLVLLALLPVVGCDPGNADPGPFAEIEPNDTEAQATVMDELHDGEFFGVCDAGEEADFFRVYRTHAADFPFTVLVSSPDPDLDLHVYAQDSSFDLTDTTPSPSGSNWKVEIATPGDLSFETNVFIEVMCLSTGNNIEYRGNFQVFG